ncbi:16S rRNA (cytosine(967)-C(5))-methyltransferase RsmB [Variovorax terrae]|uniref:16S rRNA (cytosine(967)-C(5))-methyltransferase n=1 Tax=Variovorax terrae TaxID=2923278 RepID=A0A9X1W033_9BURK|nr:16S rRNA (cytosine(967)-C(5))-methyltransferase RsmB [Variovorax terrae]MCJ0766110.1 16S rRNA (cytosine(967)-C(5))-methyltransferase RsmB [Variovorax terrae]
MTEPAVRPVREAGASSSLIPLWRQLQAAASVLAAIRAGASGTAALNDVDPGLRPGAQALVFHVLRQLGRAEALRRQLARRAPPPQVDALLCTALALGWREAEAPYEAFTLVDQAVEAAKRSPATRAQASFLNACLRRFLREREALVAATDRDPVAVWNHPRWWIERLRRDHPAHWQDILRANNSQAPMSLRVNARKSGVVQYLRSLDAMNIVATPAGDWGVTLVQARPVHDIPGFGEGVVSVQDGAAQQAAPLLLQGLAGAGPLRILDACAAPGGKTAHLLELADAQVTALDIDPVRCERIHQNLQRLGLSANVVAADAGRPQAWWDGQPFDAILLDAPCTASGIVRRHPDVRWLRRESDIAQLAAIQAALLATLWPLLKAGGRLLYCTCSVFKAEGDDQIQTFVAHNTDAVLRPSPGHLMPQTGANGGAVPDNPQGDHDGFFYALLEKHAPRRQDQDRA